MLDPFLPHVLHDVPGEYSIEASAAKRLVEFLQARRAAAVLLAIGQTLDIAFPWSVPLFRTGKNRRGESAAEGC
jgi:hypothetical protein